MEVILGTAQLVRAYGRLQRSYAPSSMEAIDLLRHAHGRGVRILDTAPTYGDAEAVIGESGLEFEIHTKILADVPVRESVERSLTRLRRDSIDLLYLHDPAVLFDAKSRILAEAQELVGTLVGSVGVSVYYPLEFDRAVQDPRVNAIQLPLNVLDRRIGDDRLRIAGTKGVRIIARSAYFQGLLVSALSDVQRAMPPLVDTVEPFHHAARNLGRPLQVLALGWVAARPNISGCAVGVDSKKQLDELLNTVRERLTPEELDTLRQLDTAPDHLLDPRRWP